MAQVVINKKGSSGKKGWSHPHSYEQVIMSNSDRSTGRDSQRVINRNSTQNDPFI